MPWVPFLVATGTGAAIWNTFLLVCGLELRQNWESVQQYSHHLDVAVLVMLLGGAAWFFYSRRRQRAGADTLTSGED